MGRYFREKDYQTGDVARQVDAAILSFLWNFAKPLRWWMGGALAVMLLGTSADLLRPYLMKVAIDRYILQNQLPGLIQIAWIYAASIAFSALFSYAQTVILQYIGQQVILDIRQKVFRHLLYKKYEDLESQPVGRMVTRVTNDTDAIKDLYTDVIVSFASDFLVLAGIMLVMLLMDWRLALAAFLVIPCMIVLAIFYQRYARKAYRLVRETTAAVNSYVQENLNGISVIKAFAGFHRTEAAFRGLSRDHLDAGLQEMRTFAVFRPLVDLMYTVAVLLVLWYGGWLNRASNVEIGVMIAFLHYVEKFFWPIKDLTEKFSLLQSALAAAERVYDLLAEAHPAEAPLAETVDYSFQGDITFSDVWFAYEEPEWVLRGLSLEIKAGEFVGVVGLSGSGKTTLLGLLLRFYEPQRGAIYLDGVDIREIPLAVLRHKVGVVFQDVHLFQGTIAENISLYNPAISRDTIAKAAQTANIHRFVENLPEQYNTPVGYQGALLSAGQRQLLSLARALASGPDVLILDEATSSVDSETEKLIQEALEAVAGQRTMLVVAHRLSTVQAAHRLFVLAHGQVVESGTHQELLANHSIYYRLYSSQ